MNKTDVLLISLRNLILSGEAFLADAFSVQFANEYIRNVQQIKEYVLKEFSDHDDLIEYVNLLPEFPNVNGRKIEESYLEKVSRLNYRLRNAIDIFNLTISPKREKIRNQLSILISKVNEDTRMILGKVSY